MATEEDLPVDELLKALEKASEEVCKVLSKGGWFHTAMDLKEAVNRAKASILANRKR